MLELKFYKELPCRSLNNNKGFVTLAGADLYNDKEGNRYAFVSVKNNYKKPFFSLYLYIKEYDSSGTFLKENKFNVPNMYGLPGIHVIDEPIPLEKECDGIEVFVVLAEYPGRNFYNDQFAKRGKEVVELNMRELRTKTAANASSVLPTSNETATLVQPQVEQLENEEGVVAPNQEVRPDADVKESKGLFNFISIAAVAILVIAMLVFILTIPSFVEGLNNAL